MIGNTATKKGGGVYNRLASKTTMVNCIIAGNTSGEEGGGTCNADDGDIPALALTEFNLHNCLIAGNEADGTTSLDHGGGHYNRNKAKSELIQCTVVGNHAEGSYGGAANADTDSDLFVQNCIVWGNTDADSGTGTLDEQLVYLDDAPESGETDKNVIEDCDGCLSEGGTNKGGGDGEDPDAVNTTSGMTWLDCTYDAATGISTFNITVEVTDLDETRFFQPEADSPLQLLIKEVDETADKIHCYGKWSNIHILATKSGTIFDYHIASGSSAIDYGAVGHLPPDDEICDLDGQTTTPNRIPFDLDGNTREQGDPALPDSGAYEIE